MQSTNDAHMQIVVAEEFGGEDGFHPHAGSTSAVMQRLDEAMAGWSKTIDQASTLAAAAMRAAQGDSPIELDEITIGLTLTAEGGLAFLAKAGAQGTIQIKFKRRTNIG